MNPEDKLKEKIGRSHGFRVPDTDFLNQVYVRVSEQLPQRSFNRPVRRTAWQIVRPYIYLAAMFAGLWLTMRIVTSMSTQPQSRVSLDNPPTLVAQAMTTPEVAEQIDLTARPSQANIVANATASYTSMDEFEKDFGYELESHIEQIDVQGIARPDAEDADSDVTLDDLYELQYYDEYAYAF